MPATRTPRSHPHTTAEGVDHGDRHHESESEVSDTETTHSAKGKTKKTGTKQTHRPWTQSEDDLFYGLVDEIVKEHLWEKAKENPALAARLSAGVKAHWKAAFRRMTSKPDQSHAR